MASLLKNRVFTNPLGELVNLNLQDNLCVEYDIFNIWNFPQGCGLKVKIGSYSPSFPESQQLHISEDLKWAMGETLVCTCDFQFFSTFMALLYSWDQFSEKQI